MAQTMQQQLQGACGCGVPVGDSCAALRSGMKPPAAATCTLARCTHANRVASRQMEQQGLALSFDHGAQQVTAIGADFQAQLAEWQAAGVAAEWRGRHGEIAGAVWRVTCSKPATQGSGCGCVFGAATWPAAAEPTARYTAAAGGAFRPRPEQPGSSGASGFCGSQTGLPLYVGVPTNNAIAQHMAAQLQSHSGAQLLSGVAVQSMERVGGGCGCGSGGSKWQLRGSRKGRAAAAEPGPAEQQDDLGLFDAVVLADAMPLLPGWCWRAGGRAFGGCAAVQPAVPQPNLLLHELRGTWARQDGSVQQRCHPTAPCLRVPTARRPS